MSDGFSKKAEDASHRLIEALGRVYLQVSDSGGEKRRDAVGGEDVDGGVDRSSVRTAVGQVSTKDVRISWPRARLSFFRMRRCRLYVEK